MKRGGSFVLRLERSGSEIDLHNAFRMRTTLRSLRLPLQYLKAVYLCYLTHSLTLEIVALQLCGRFVRRLFLGLSDSSISITLFLDCTALFSDFLACVRCACVLAAISLRSVISAVF